MALDLKQHLKNILLIKKNSGLNWSFNIYLPAKNGPNIQPDPLNKFRIPIELAKFFKPTTPIKYEVVNAKIPAFKLIYDPN